ncbi:hypothetical protein KSP40_PGU004572 [Platanthera guangdongensis]|uniref:Uncharacterized protein n=1 Tax=Platanthera guangdongensis TaxID=2320717 RepID=A0ABR2M981_9ASPA
MRQFLLKLLPTILLIALISSYYQHSNDWDGPWKSPFRPTDFLPFLPFSVSRPLLRSLHSAVDLLPAFVGAVSSPKANLQWKGACFYNNTAWMEFHNKSKSPFGGGTLHIKVTNAHSWTCMDLYVFATPYRVTWDYYLLSREHTLEFAQWEEEAEYEYVKNHGISIFLMQSGMLGTFRAMWDVFPLFTNTGWGENSNLAFLKKHMGAKFDDRPKPWFSSIDVNDVHSGDFLALSKIRGRWGGFETLEKWVSGAFAGHTAVCLKDSEGKLWVAESGHENDKGEDVIAILTWEEWWEFELHKDDSNPHISLLPLHPDVRAKFNSTAAWEYARSMDGKPYGYHNMIFSWIDTVKENYPPPLDANLVASAMIMWTKIQPAYAANMWNEALNKRLGTKVCRLRVDAVVSNVVECISTLCRVLINARREIKQEGVCVCWRSLEGAQSAPMRNAAWSSLSGDVRIDNEALCRIRLAKVRVACVAGKGEDGMLFSCATRAVRRGCRREGIRGTMTGRRRDRTSAQASMLARITALIGLDLPDIIVETEKFGLSFDKLLAIPEQDDWSYSDGKSTSCVAFILEMYKHAGLFNPIASSIQVTEFTQFESLLTNSGVLVSHRHTLGSTNLLNGRLNLVSSLTTAEEGDIVITERKSIARDRALKSNLIFVIKIMDVTREMWSHGGGIVVTGRIKDAYMLNFFEDNSSRLPEWCNKDDDRKLPFCQIKGKYRMELPGYNTMQPYPHMNERCPSLPPNYGRPRFC